jgi:polysaccharide export outer membrane protein
MLYTVRSPVGCSRLKPVWLFGLLIWGIQAGYCQEKLETPQQTNERIQQLATKASTRPVNTPIGSGDLLHIEVFDVPDFTRDVRVNQTGEISLPLIPGTIQAGGLTPFELQGKVANLLQENGLVSHPQVSVFVKEQTSQPVSVIGAVKSSQIIQILRPTTLLEVLAQAGGIADDAGSVVLVIRSTAGSAPPPPTAAEPSGPAGQVADASASGSTTQEKIPDSQTITVKLRDLLESGDPTFNIPVYGGDVVSVPRSGIVYVAGAVQAPGGYVLQDRGEQITTLKAIALAHGLKSTAKANSAVIVRSNPQTGRKEEVPVRLKTIMAQKTEDVRLYPNDLLFVPDSTGKKALYKTGEAAMTIGSGLAIVRAGR